MKIPISNEILDNFTLIYHNYLVSKDYYDDKSGIQEYRLYSYLTTFFNNCTILDIGTLNGRSAVSLSYNESNKVISYDINNNINNDSHIIYSKSNIIFNIKNVLDDLNEELIKNTKIVMIDIDHYETIETLIINRLKELNFSGIILLDDITKHPEPLVNQCMNRLWNKLRQSNTETYDFTEFGHWSGTGLIVMNDNITFEFL
jgi:predicted O-methyltransferase YrrM